MIKNFTLLHKNILILLGLSLLGFLLRFVGQPDIPAGFHRDEAGIVYSAYSLLRTGRDDWGKILPLHTKALGDYPPAFYNYLVAVTIPFFGLSELAERLPAIVFGTLLIPLSYLWVKKLFGRETLSLMVAAIVTISPWDIVQSRSGSEPIVALAFTLTAWLLWWLWIKQAKKWHLPVITLLYLAALFTYNAVKLALPLLQILLMWYWWRQLPKKFLVVLFSSIFILLSLGSVYLIPGAGDNFEENNIFIHNEPLGQAYFFREGNMGVPVFLSRILHNRVTNTGTQILGNFGTFLSSDFLFFHAAKPGRYEVPGMGQLLPFFAPFLLLGVFVSDRFARRQRLFLLGWILIALLPAVITTTAFPHVKRSMYLYLPLYIFIAEGLLLSIAWVKKIMFSWLLLLLMAIAGLWSLGYFVNQYLAQTQYETILARDYGYKQAYEFIATVESNYKMVRVYGFEESPEVFYFVYRKIDPKLVQAVADVRPSNIFADMNERRNWQFGTYFFDIAKCPELKQIQSHILYFTDAVCMKSSGGKLIYKDVSILKEINYPSDSKRFIIFEKKDI